MPDPLSPVPYDISEAALKGLYPDREDDDDILALIVEPERRNKSDPEDRLADEGRVGPPPLPLKIEPLRAESREPINRPKPTEKAKRKSKIGYVVIAVGILLAFGLLTYHPASTPLATEAAKRPPAIAGALRVADLAAGRRINPGETYAFDLPTGKVRISVVAGEVALTGKGGETLRSCSSQSFVVDAASGSVSSAHPLVSACGRAPSFLQAEIPPPPLPSPAPPVAISPATLRAGGD